MLVLICLKEDDIDGESRVLFKELNAKAVYDNDLTKGNRLKDVFSRFT